mmetsp:Transcript_34729/g.63791  ORF Transcript_34729/g.63791 Transcript_34729/m.63791 type:complete len:515 (-) Transcript_34729:1315-2859(-)
MSSNPASSGNDKTSNDKTVATTTLSDGMRRLVTTIVLPNGTRTTTQILPSLPVVTTETTHHADGSGSNVKETTTVVHPGGRMEATIRERFVPAPSSSSPTTQQVDNVATNANAVVTAVRPISSITGHHGTIAGPSPQEETKGQVEVEMLNGLEEEPDIVEKPAVVEEPSDSKSDSVLHGDYDTANTTVSQNERDSGSSGGAAKFRSGWSSTPKLPKAQIFVPVIDPRETAVQRRRREEMEAREAAAQREKEEEARRLAEEEAAVRLEHERLAAEALAAEEAKAERLEQACFAAEEATRQAELDRLEQERIEQEKALAELISWAEQRRAPIKNGLSEAEEGAVTEHSRSAAVAVEEEEEEGIEPHQKKLWQQNNCRCTSLFLLLLILGGVVGLVLGLKNGNVTEQAIGAGTMTSGGDSSDDVALIPLVVDRSCQWRKSQTVDLDVVTNRVNNRMWGSASDFDGNNAVIVSHNTNGIGAVWALSKNVGSGTWEQAAFQTENEDHFGWDGEFSIVCV